MRRRPARVEVSDHAALRWLERQHGLDVAAVKAAIAGMAMNGAQLQAVAVCIDDVRLVLREKLEGRPGEIVVVTVLDRDAKFGEQVF